MPTKISYSSASRFKECPTKYYMSKSWAQKTKPSAFPFGSAIEEGVTELIKNHDLERGINVFHRHWMFEKGDSSLPVYGNPLIEYYDSDLALEVIETEAAKKSLLQYLGEEAAEANWEEAFEVCQKLLKEGRESTEERGYVQAIFWLSCLARGKLMLEAFYEELLPKITGITQIKGEPGVQYPIDLEDGNGNSINGFIDYVLHLEGHKRPVIIDCKTAGQPYDEHKMLSSDQLRTYAAYLEETLGECDVGYMVLLKKIKFTKSCVKCGEKQLDFAANAQKCKVHGDKFQKKAKVGTQLLTHHFSSAELDATLSGYQNIITAIDAGVNYKNPTQCMNYNRPCEFYDVCWKNKRPEEIVHLEKKEPKNG